MNLSEDMFKSLERVDTSSLDYLAVLNYLDPDLPHSDVDVFAILETGADVKMSQYEHLYSFMRSFETVTGNSSYVFSSFRHQMFFTCELRRRGIGATPIHLLVYPGSFYLHQWEIPSRIRSMIRTSRKVYRSRKWQLGTAAIPKEPYQPFVFLQALYEAYILWTGANIESESVRMDVLKKLEFSCKNLSIEALLKCEGMTRKFNTSWAYLIDHLGELKQEGVPIHAVERAWALKKNLKGCISPEDIDSYFNDAFIFYDAVISCMFSE